jgi:coenzyme F420-reducing hydrogenase beta subunit
MKQVIDNLNHCMGCGACQSLCKTDAINLVANSEGFLYPSIEAEKCSHCGVCSNSCPSSGKEQNLRLNPFSMEAYASWSKQNKFRSESSSGGIFSEIAIDTLNRDGRVYGAVFDENLNVLHLGIDSERDLHRLRGSKYVQSHISKSTYKEIEKELKMGRQILFSGTPCQIAGLKQYLRKDYPSLVTCDVLCHGTPSPKLWAAYLEHEKKKIKDLSSYSFRDKTNGWSNFGVKLISSNGKSSKRSIFSDSYMLSFLGNLSLRESCYTCKWARSERPGDVSLGDFWGVHNFHPDIDRGNAGTSLILINTPKGQDIINRIRNEIFTKSVKIDDAIPGNKVLIKPSPRPKNRDFFYRELNESGYKKLITTFKLYKPSIYMRALQKLTKTIRKFK